MELILISATLIGQGTDLIGQGQGQDLEENPAKMKIMAGGMEFQAPKVEDLLVIVMIQVFLPVQGLGEKKIQRSTLETTGKRGMEVEQVLGMMQSQKMLQRNLNFY